MTAQPRSGDKVFREIPLALGALGIVLTWRLRSWGRGSMFPNLGRSGLLPLSPGDVSRAPAAAAPASPSRPGSTTADPR